MQVLGTDPQTGVTINTFDCAIGWLPMLLIEGSRASSCTAASVDSFRNEVLKKQVLIDAFQAAQIDTEEDTTDALSAERLQIKIPQIPKKTE